MVILPGIRVIVRRFLCIERRFLSDWSKKFYVDVLAQCALVCWEWLHQVRGQARPLLLTGDNTTGIVTTYRIKSILCND